VNELRSGPGVWDGRNSVSEDNDKVRQQDGRSRRMSGLNVGETMQRQTQRIDGGQERVTGEEGKGLDRGQRRTRGRERHGVVEHFTANWTRHQACMYNRPGQSCISPPYAC
jgi:hypothetical protein